MNTTKQAAVAGPVERGVGRLEPERADLLDMDYINSLPQPLWANHLRAWWPVHDIDVKTGMLRIDACGLLDVLHIGGLLKFRDDSGTEHHADDFYAESESWVNREPPNVRAKPGAVGDSA